MQPFVWCSVQSLKSCPTLQPRRLQHARLRCPSPTPGVYPNSCPLSWPCQPTISSSVVPFSSCLQSFPASGSFPMSQLFAWGGQSIGVSVSASVSPSSEYSGLISFRIDWFDLIAVQVLSKIFLVKGRGRAMFITDITFRSSILYYVFLLLYHSNLFYKNMLKNCVLIFRLSWIKYSILFWLNMDCI